VPIEPAFSVNVHTEDMTCSLALGPKVRIVKKELQQRRDPVRILITNIKANDTETLVNSDFTPKMVHINRYECRMSLPSEKRGYSLILYNCSRP
jgi:hypothetical protein